MSTAVPPTTREANTASVLDPRPAPTYLDAASAGMAMSEAEYEAVEDWDRAYRYERLDGRVVVSPAPNWRAQTLNDIFATLQWNYRRSAHGRDSAIDHTHAEVDIPTSRGMRRADRALWCGLGRKPTHADIPTIAVEIVSKDERDRHRDFVEKRREYLEAGVREYWIFDPLRRTLTVCTTAEGDAGRQVVNEAEAYRTNLLPGFALPVGELLAEAEAVEE